MTAVLYGLIDLPLSFAADTLWLPYDTYMVTGGGKHRDGTAAKEDKQPTASEIAEPPAPADAR
jgi:hypothetical protein